MDQSLSIIVMRRSVGTLHFAQSSTQPTNHDLNEDNVGGDDEQFMQLVIYLVWYCWISFFSFHFCGHKTSVDLLLLVRYGWRSKHVYLTVIDKDTVSTQGYDGCTQGPWKRRRKGRIEDFGNRCIMEYGHIIVIIITLSSSSSSSSSSLSIPHICHFFYKGKIFGE